MSSFKIKPKYVAGGVDFMDLFSLYDIERIDDDSSPEESDEIKPCPFCGKMPQLKVMLEPIHQKPSILWLRCDACDMEMGIVLNGRSKWEAFEELQEKWNRRT